MQDGKALLLCCLHHCKEIMFFDGKFQPSNYTSKIQACDKPLCIQSATKMVTFDVNLSLEHIHSSHPPVPRSHSFESITTIRRTQSHCDKKRWTRLWKVVKFTNDDKKFERCIGNAPRLQYPNLFHLWKWRIAYYIIIWKAVILRPLDAILWSQYCQ